jgi:hypothetical protein
MIFMPYSECIMNIKQTLLLIAEIKSGVNRHLVLTEKALYEFCKVVEDPPVHPDQPQFANSPSVGPPASFKNFRTYQEIRAKLKTFGLKNIEIIAFHHLSINVHCTGIRDEIR